MASDLLHGEAVAIGMVLAFDLSARLGLCPPEDAARVERHLAAVGLPTEPDGHRAAASGTPSAADRPHAPRQEGAAAAASPSSWRAASASAFIARDVNHREASGLLEQALLIEAAAAVDVAAASR